MPFRKKSHVQNSRRRPVAEVFEKRYLLSVDLPGLEAANDPFLANDLITDGELRLIRSAMPAVNDSIFEDDSGVLNDGSVTEESFVEYKQLIVIDAAVDNVDQLVDDIVNNGDSNTQYEVLLLDIDADGVAQITDQLDGDTIYEAIHVISHGTEDSLSLGNTDLNSENVGQYQNEFTSWANSLTDGADLLLYGCDLASTDEGLTLLATLATFTTADVAASDDVTGHRSLGGDWILEYSTGDIEAGLPFSDQLLEDWVYTLDVSSDEPTEPNEAPTNEGDLPDAITVEEDVPSDVDLSLIELSDVDADDANGDELTVTLTTGTGGQLSGVAETGMGITLGGTATALTVTGTQTDLNSYFGTASNIQYVHSTADLNGDGADTIQVSVNDNGNTGLGGGEDVNLGTVDVNITAINDTPEVTGAGSPYEAVEQEPPIDIHGTGLSVSDVDADDNGRPLIADLTVGEGSILVDVGNSGVAVNSAISTDTARLNGTQTQINNLLEGSGTGTIVYIADSDAPSATTTLTLSVNDRGNTGSDPGLTGSRTSEQDSVSQTINITAVNDSPELLGQELITNGNFDNGTLVGWTIVE